MAALTTQEVTWASGLVSPSYAAAAASDTVEGPTYGAQIVLVVKNTNAASRTITVTAPGTNNYGANNPDPAYTVNATTGETFIPMHPSWVDSTGRIGIACTPAITNVTYAVLKFSQNA